MPRVVRLAFLLLLTAALAFAACRGSGGEEKTAKETLATVKPLKSAQVGATLRIFFDHAPASVGDRLELTFAGPLRNNGADKLPSLDWKVAFSGLTTHFTSRVVSTGDNVFVNLGGQDFEVGQEAVQRLADQAREARQKGLAQVGLNPLAAVRDVHQGGTRAVDGTPTTVYAGVIDLDAVMDQYERLSRSMPIAGGAVPQGRLTAAQRAQVKRTFGRPRFEADVAQDDTIRRLVVTSTFRTAAANRDAAGGITGGRIEYRLQYTDVGEATMITPPRNPQPIADFARGLQAVLDVRRHHPRPR